MDLGRLHVDVLRPDRNARIVLFRLHHATRRILRVRLLLLQQVQLDHE